jgi:quercetin dioxygenase-like cupin family protein
MPPSLRILEDRSMSQNNTTFSLSTHPIHLGLGARVIPQPPFTGAAWYDDYTTRTAGDGAEGRLVSLHTFSAPWDSWEMHPHGEELVVCITGALRLIQEIDGQHVPITLQPGEAIINPPGVWHTADLPAGESATVLFITAGLGTEIRPRT